MNYFNKNNIDIRDSTISVESTDTVDTIINDDDELDYSLNNIIEVKGGKNKSKYTEDIIIPSMKGLNLSMEEKKTFKKEQSRLINLKKYNENKEHKEKIKTKNLEYARKKYDTDEYREYMNNYMKKNVNKTDERKEYMRDYMKKYMIKYRENKKINKTD